DKSPDEDISPKPTIFFPSIAEIKLCKAETYLCLLEDFFPDVFKIDWKEKDDKTILKSQQGDTMKTNDTYMKFSWLTVTRQDKGNVDQEILFPSINKGITLCFKGKTQPFLSNTLQVQLMNTSAYYTYLLLFLKSLVYSIIIVSLLGRPSLYSNGKSS
uniref:Immunoglobulin C1-set domain-containing protein n=1 Tax=Neovison vison TaxID=452646 RepID=A0A8C7C550_NEOVI